MAKKRLRPPNAGSFAKGFDPRRFSRGGKDLAALLQKYGTYGATLTILDLAENGTSESTRLAASQYILDRAYGKPDKNVQHTINPGQDFLQALKEIQSRPRPEVKMIEGSTVEATPIAPSTDDQSTDNQHTDELVLCSLGQFKDRLKELGAEMPKGVWTPADGPMPDY